MNTPSDFKSNPKTKLLDHYPTAASLRQELWQIFIASVDNSEDGPVIISDRALLILHVTETLTEEIYSPAAEPPAD